MNVTARTVSAARRSIAMGSSLGARLARPHAGLADGANPDHHLGLEGRAVRLPGAGRRRCRRPSSPAAPDRPRGHHRRAAVGGRGGREALAPIRATWCWPPRSSSAGCSWCSASPRTCPPTSICAAWNQPWAARRWPWWTVQRDQPLYLFGWLGGIYSKRFLLGRHLRAALAAHRRLLHGAGHADQHPGVRRGHGHAVAGRGAAGLPGWWCTCSGCATWPRCRASPSSATRWAPSSVPGAAA